MTNGEFKRYELRWGRGGVVYDRHLYLTLEAAKHYLDFIYRHWCEPGDEIEIVELSGIAAKTISKEVKK